MGDFKRYRRTQVAEIRTYEPGEEGHWTEPVSISDADRKAGSPKLGDMIARNPKNHEDQWLVAADYFAANFEPMAQAPTPHPLDQACAELAALAKEWGDDYVDLRVYRDGKVLVDLTHKAHLHGADGLPLPSAALAALRGGK